MWSMSRGYKLAPSARKDLERIWLYSFEKWSRQQADTYYQNLTACFVRIAEGTTRGKSLSRIKQGYFYCPCGSHFVIYSNDCGVMQIVRILHKRMNILKHL